MTTVLTNYEPINLHDMSTVDAVCLLREAGEVVFDAAITRLLMSLGEAEITTLEVYIKSSPGTEQDAVTFLLDRYPHFGQLIAEEAAALRETAASVYSQGE